MCSRMRRTPAVYAARSSERRPVAGRGARASAPARARAPASVRTSPKRAQVRPALEVRGDGPEAGGVEGGGVAGDVAQVGGDEAAEAGQRGEVVHAVESMAGARECRDGVAAASEHDRSTLRKRVFVLARESARVHHVAGTRKRTGNDRRT